MTDDCLGWKVEACLSKISVMGAGGRADLMRTAMALGRLSRRPW